MWDRPCLGGPVPAVEFGRPFDTYAHPLHRYFARRVGSDAAHYLVSETFLVALHQRHSDDPRRGVVPAWLYGIAAGPPEARDLRAVARSAGHAPDQDANHDSAVAELSQRGSGRPAAEVLGANASRGDWKEADHG